MSKMNMSFKKRCFGAIALLLAIILADCGKLIWIQIVKADEYRLSAEGQQLSDTQIPAARGVIYDANMEILAESADAWLVFVNPSKIKDDAMRQKIASGLSEILDDEDLDYDTIYKKIGNKGINYVEIKGELDFETKEKISEFIDGNYAEGKPEFYDIVVINSDTTRYYPYSNFASSVIGAIKSDDTGRSGLELMYDDILTGIPGRTITARDATGNLIKSNYSEEFPGVDGTNLVLTIDKTVQHYLEKGLSEAVTVNKAASAYGIVMDVDTGAVLAMATMPDYDLNNSAVIKDKKTLKELAKIKDPEKYSAAYNTAVYNMWRNKAISDTYEPGSVFKIFVAAAGLEEGVVDANFTNTCTGAIQVADNLVRCHDHAGHGTVDMSRALMKSCNPYFITVGQRLGVDKFLKYFEAFGFADATGVDLPGEAKPVEGVTYHSYETMGLPQLSSESFGQSFQISAMQMITGVSAIANGGKLMEPYIVSKQIDANGNTIFEKEVKVKRQVISETTAEQVLAMMEQVVGSDEGTGRNARVDGYRVAGKTGTSEKLTKDGEYIASFVGCAPANDPEIAVLIVIDEPQVANHGGGAIAAPVAGAVIEQTLRYMNVEPVYTAEQLEKLDQTTPEVKNLSVSAAIDALESKGFTARVVGNGDTVVAQFPAQGQSIPAEGVVILYTDTNGKNTTAAVPKLTGMSVSEANKLAINSGFNIRVTGPSEYEGVISYSQSIAEGTKAELGTTITVNFKTNTGVQDD